MLHPVGMSASSLQTATCCASDRDGKLAAATMWNRMLANVPTSLGKLVSVASFRVGSSGEYSHPVLDRVLSPEVASHVLRESHEHLFAEWVGLFIDEQSEDVERYLENLRKEGVRDLLRKAAENLVPVSACPVARRAFLNDLEQILAAGDPLLESRLEPDLLAIAV